MAVNGFRSMQLSLSLGLAVIALAGVLVHWLEPLAVLAACGALSVSLLWHAFEFRRHSIHHSLDCGGRAKIVARSLNVHAGFPTVQAAILLIMICVGIVAVFAPWWMALIVSIVLFEGGWFLGRHETNRLVRVCDDFKEAAQELHLLAPEPTPTEAKWQRTHARPLVNGAIIGVVAPFVNPMARMEYPWIALTCLLGIFIFVLIRGYFTPRIWTLFNCDASDKEVLEFLRKSKPQVAGHSVQTNNLPLILNLGLILTPLAFSGIEAWVMAGAAAASNLVLYHMAAIIAWPKARTELYNLQAHVQKEFGSLGEKTNHV